MPRPLGAEDAGGVAVVDHDDGVVAVGQVADVRQRGERAVHREDAVGGDQPQPAAGRLLQAAVSRSAMSQFL